ncbi:IS5 family transposase ISUnCu15 [bioreactor metagenome]|uniref:IS5 family transposase ISUnCu15 n=1 Tax=bioreactor metagenome TaxID=1076179 RepID=A0A644VN57_9ZZZZ
MVASLLKMADLDWAVPDYTTLCRRQKALAVQIPCRRADRPLNLLIDRTGIKFLDDGEWRAREHGIQGRRQWRKVHLAMDTATPDIRAVEFTPSSDGDSPVLPELLGQIPDGEEIGMVTADGAYDTRRCHTSIIDRQAEAIIPIRKTGRPWKEDCPAAFGAVLGPCMDGSRVTRG